ncbi:MAG: LamG-like jellyroll fold domain-containing protein, partial [Ignavibacteria bacterium]|nr:LamG-like jellyroll fold domain-containing protein [Ignavibacteria bacterium]
YPDVESYTWWGKTTDNGYVNGHHHFRHPPGWPRPTWYADVAGTDMGFRTYLLNTTVPDITAPSAPTSLTAIGRDKAIDLTWKKNSEGDVKVYRIYGGTSANPITKIDSVNYTDTTKTITNLTNGTTYYYRITAVDSTGNQSNFSNEVSTKPYDLVAYYPFNGNTNDESGNGNNAINVSAVAAQDRFGVDGKSYYFDGSQSRMYKDVGTEFRLGNNFTLSIWINVSGNGTDSPRLVAVGPLSTSANYYSMYLDMASRRVGFLLPSPLDPVWSNYITGASKGWKLVTATYDGTMVKIYIDNKLDVSSNVSYNFPSFSSARLQIGYSENSVPTDKFNGKLDDIRIYNRALTEPEIDSLYTDGGYNSITYGGKVYHTVKIGTQTWLKENLDIGTMIQGN